MPLLIAGDIGRLDPITESLGTDEIALLRGGALYRLPISELADVPMVTRRVVREVDSSGSILDTDDVVLADATSGEVTLALPAAATVSGRVFIVKKIDGVANNVIIDPNGSETIDGISTQTISTQYNSVEFISDGTQWWII